MNYLPHSTLHKICFQTIEKDSNFWDFLLVVISTSLEEKDGFLSAEQGRSSSQH